VLSIRIRNAPAFVYNCQGADTISKDERRAAQGYKQVVKKHLLPMLFNVGPRAISRHYRAIAGHYSWPETRSSPECPNLVPICGGPVQFELARKGQDDQDFGARKPQPSEEAAKVISRRGRDRPIIIAATRSAHPIDPAPITKEPFQSNPRVRALRHPQVRVKGSSLKHAEALPCIRYTV
jgi:hypothetical protein